ncbi:Hfq-related RNA-binding protein [Gloeobacter kilaueensis]|uniref:Hfq-related domain-containing protein n=1 Tax=Gloeobacter kilaueensis (strain ATCC BAA-2537 / CCAP 1431/1 / ULC 316 / JS1) TaxID=1183438 RepID=U5QMX0_GLOK1|nr:RNA chaperone Hfq [Gloeobacter kilaueensis]AGY59020.1 hypothetical protein GKIL_2774 [Gloeobacter kilaueensis JS1]
MSPLDLSLPSTRYLQTLIRDQVPVQLTTLTGENLNGRLRWQDGECLCLACGDGEILLWRSAVATVRPRIA